MHPLLKSLIGIIVGLGIGVGIVLVYPPVATNPDSNHTHADFAVWIDGKQLDFSDAKYMTTEEQEEKLPPNHIKRFLHLHDGDGHVMHRHKPGLTVEDFFATLGGMSCVGEEFNFPAAGYKTVRITLYVNGKPFSEDGPGCSYVFEDGDKLLLTDATDPTEVQKELSILTSDACRYSKTCPWKGKPQTESCISDPTIPCKQ